MGRVFKNSSELGQHLASIRKGKKVVFTNGCFDILHIGHVRYLQEAKALGDFLVVAINTDQSVKVIKGPSRPIQNESDRAEILAALGAVDFVTYFSEDTPEKVIGQIKPDILVKGGDWPVDKIVGAKFVMSYGGEVRTLQFIEGRSTTSIVDKMKN